MLCYNAVCERDIHSFDPEAASIDQGLLSQRTNHAIASNPPGHLLALTIVLPNIASHMISTRIELCLETRLILWSAYALEVACLIVLAGSWIDATTLFFWNISVVSCS